MPLVPLLLVFGASVVQPLLMAHGVNVWQKLARAFTAVAGYAAHAICGLAQGCMVTAPAMLIILLVGQEGTLGVTEGVGGILSAGVL